MPYDLKQTIIALFLQCDCCSKFSITIHSLHILDVDISLKVNILFRDTAVAKNEDNTCGLPDDIKAD